MKGREFSAAQNIITATPLGCVVSVGELFESITAEKWIELHKEALNAEASWALRELRFGNYAPGRGVWRFRNMRRLVTPIPVRGGQQWFNLPPDVEAAVRAQLNPVVPAGPVEPSRCFRCNGSGELCDTCGEALSVCGCGEEQNIGECPDCKGTGK
jgi:hypothetical protein